MKKLGKTYRRCRVDKVSLTNIYLVCHFHNFRAVCLQLDTFMFLNLEVRDTSSTNKYLHQFHIYSLLLWILLKLNGKNWVAALRISSIMDFPYVARFNFYFILLLIWLNHQDKKDPLNFIMCWLITFWLFNLQLAMLTRTARRIVEQR